MARHFTRIVTTPAAARRPHDATRPFVSLLTDWGLRDPSPAIARGVILGIAPDAQVIDISHEVEKYNIRHGALVLWAALPFLPVGAHAAVIDPGVGTPRRPIAIEVARGDYLIGPDNGLMLAGAERLGGIVRVHLIENPQYHLPVVTATFHGRDLFAPAAAHLALGVPLDAIGAQVDPASLVRLDWPPVVVRDGELETTVIYRDTFGNLKLAGLAADLADALPGLEHGETLIVESVGRGSKTRRHQVPWTATFGDVPVGELVILEDSYGRLTIGQNQGSAAATLRVGDGDVLRLIRAPGRQVAGSTGEDQATDTADSTG
jgi:S-adenosyl-L-methionine hydrolase (adenosine-forming)